MFPKRPKIRLIGGSLADGAEFLLHTARGAYTISVRADHFVRKSKYHLQAFGRGEVLHLTQYHRFNRFRRLMRTGFFPRIPLRKNRAAIAIIEALLRTGRAKLI